MRESTTPADWSTIEIGGHSFPIRDVRYDGRQVDVQQPVTITIGRYENTPPIFREFLGVTRHE